MKSNLAMPLLLVIFANLVSIVHTIVITEKLSSELTRFKQDFILTEKRTVEQLARHLNGPRNEDFNLNISQVINKHGFEFEQHDITTTDGYILSLHRIPGQGKAVLLVHGILQSSESWIAAGPDDALSYLLASHGYDVWMFNARGNVHSRKHQFLDPESEKFWNFSWDEIGRYDIPATIDYILDLKRHKKLIYVGFSQGSTCFFVMCSELPVYNKKISVMISLSSIAWLSHLYSPVIRFMLKIDAFSLFTRNKYELLPLTGVNSVLYLDNSVFKFMYANFLYAIFGFDRGELNVNILPLIFNHLPAGCSMKQLRHYEQLLYSGKFRKFDYGRRKNLDTYGSLEPPDYNVKKVTSPVVIFHSHFDWLSNITDVLILKNKLGNVVDFHVVQGTFNHIDFIYGKDVKELVNSRIIDILNSLFTI